MAEAGLRTLTVRYGRAAGATARAVFQARYLTPLRRSVGNEAMSSGLASPMNPSTPLTSCWGGEPAPCWPGESRQVKMTNVAAPRFVPAALAAQLVATRHSTLTSSDVAARHAGLLGRVGIAFMLEQSPLAVPPPSERPDPVELRQARILGGSERCCRTDHHAARCGQQRNRDPTHSQQPPSARLRGSLLGCFGTDPCGQDVLRLQVRHRCNRPRPRNAA
jgi:hypothetical protein